jgi:aspartyl-tRNA(Asn)/glutamyl-tRNA(Gln) amidotransferase subunit B
VDANISLRPAGESRLGTKTEIKNLNSFANIERALDAERTRQLALLEQGEAVSQVTLLFNAATGAVRPMRSKEESHDYRYFPDPDLPPLVLEPAWIESVRAELPELPSAKRARLMAVFGVPSYDAGVLASERGIADYFESVVAAGAPAKVAANWIMQDGMTGYNQSGSFAVPPARLAELIALVERGVLSHQAAKKVYLELTVAGGEPRGVAERLGLVQVRDESELERWVDEVLAAHPKEVERFRAGETKLLGFLTGQVMKRSQGKADPKGVQPVLQRRLTRL